MSEFSIACTLCGANNTIVIVGSLGSRETVNCSNCLNPLGRLGDLASVSGGCREAAPASDLAWLANSGRQTQTA